jgi:hypothetical protein
MSRARHQLTLNDSIWIQKSVVLLLYKRMLNGLRWPSQIMNIYWITLGVTYVVVEICTFVDCYPLYLYWQVVPDPGRMTRPRNHWADANETV